MANALVQPYVSGTQQAIQAPLYDPRFEESQRRRFHRPLLPMLENANALFVSSGLCPARGWVLLRRADYDQLNKYATNFQLQLEDFNSGAVITFQNLALVQARCVSRGVSADPDAVYLVELTDWRGLVYNSFYQQPTNSFYNVRSPAYPQQYYQDSLQGGVNPWTWNGMLADLWGQMPLLGAYPGLPVTPTDTVEGFTFSGVSCWEAVNLILDLLGCTVAVDLTQASPYTIVDLSATDTSLSTLQQQYANRLEDDLEYIDVGSGRAPKQVIVYFQRRNDQYGTEETVRRDNFQWSSTPLYSVTIPAPAQYANAVGTHYLWCEFTVRFDVDNDPLFSDVLTANLVAQERVNEYYARFRNATLGYMQQTYAGALPFKTSAQCDGVKWYMDFRARDYKREDDPVFRMMADGNRPEVRHSGRLGWRTDVVRGLRPAWPQVLLDNR